MLPLVWMKAVLQQGNDGLGDSTSNETTQSYAATKLRARDVKTGAGN